MRTLGCQLVIGNVFVEMPLLIILPIIPFLPVMEFFLMSTQSSCTVRFGWIDGSIDK